jgi:dimethylhistidine N-methyltransferase
MPLALSSNIQFSDYHPTPVDFFSEVVDGLRQNPKAIAPKFFYDKEGSRLFDAICELDEYYLTRTEMRILSEHADEIAGIIGEKSFVIEPGSGSSTKVRLLLDTLKPHIYMPMDISKQHLLNSAQDLAAEYPWLDIHAACADFTTRLVIPEQTDTENKVAFFPGSSIGNFEPEAAIDFLAHLGETVGKGGGLLIGVDLKKDPEILNAAYNDAAGVTAEFNLNLLQRINRELQADFDLNAFRHNAFYNRQKSRVEMHLVSLKKQNVTIAQETFEFARDETIHTECSYKYSIHEFQTLAANAGYRLLEVWTDPNGLFSVHYYEYMAGSA